MAYNPLFPDVPFTIGVPPVGTPLLAQAGSIINSQTNINIGAAQHDINGIISNVQSGNFGGAVKAINGAYGQLATLLTGHSPAVTAQADKGQWGIFPKGSTSNPVVDPDSFLSLDYKHEWKIANYPMEEGAFKSYNKVQTPFDVKVAMVQGGSTSDINQFLTAVETVAQSTTLYDVVTPSWTYHNVSIETIAYRRSATQGVTLLTVELGLAEVRITDNGTFTNTASAAGAGQINIGTVQTSLLTAGSTATFANILTASSSGKTLTDCFAAQTTFVPNLIPAGISAPITGTLNPVNAGITEQIVLSGTPVASSVAAQAALLNKVQ